MCEVIISLTNSVICLFIQLAMVEHILCQTMWSLLNNNGEPRRSVSGPTEPTIQWGIWALTSYIYIYVNVYVYAYICVYILGKQCIL